MARNDLDLCLSVAFTSLHWSMRSKLKCQNMNIELSDARGRQDEGNFKKKGEGPWHHSTGTATPAEINRMSDTQKYRYVRTGKK